MEKPIKYFIIVKKNNVVISKAGGDTLYFLAQEVRTFVTSTWKLLLLRWEVHHIKRERERKKSSGSAFCRNGGLA